jgi:carboxypeptidase family protein
MSQGLTTKRMVLGQLTVRAGCCCGNVGRGLPAVPIDWLKEEWRRRRLLKRVQLTISAALLLSQAAQAQASASLHGTVRDSDGGIVAGATVVVQAAGGGERRTARTNGQGTYTFAALPAGEYDLQVDSPGFRPFRRQRLVVGGNTALEVDATLVAAGPLGHGAGILLSVLVALLAVRLLRASRS